MRGRQKYFRWISSYKFRAVGERFWKNPEEVWWPMEMEEAGREMEAGGEMETGGEVADAEMVEEVEAGAEPVDAAGEVGAAASDEEDDAWSPRQRTAGILPLGECTIL